MNTLLEDQDSRNKDKQESDRQALALAVGVLGGLALLTIGFFLLVAFADHPSEPASECSSEGGAVLSVVEDNLRIDVYDLPGFMDWFMTPNNHPPVCDSTPVTIAFGTLEEDRVDNGGNIAEWYYGISNLEYHSDTGTCTFVKDDVVHQEGCTLVGVQEDQRFFDTFKSAVYAQHPEGKWNDSSFEQVSYMKIGDLQPVDRE